MSSYQDSITDNTVMAGSPDTLMCLDIDFQTLLGDCARPIIGLKELEFLCKKNNKLEILERIELAKSLVKAAQYLFCYPIGEETDIDAAKQAVSILKNNK